MTLEYPCVACRGRVPFPDSPCSLPGLLIKDAFDNVSEAQYRSKAQAPVPRGGDPSYMRAMCGRSPDDKKLESDAVAYL